MNSLESNCVDTIVNHGDPDLLSEKLPPLLHQLVVNKIRDKNKPTWKENIYVVHMDLLIKKGSLFLDIETAYGELNFTYSNENITIKLHGEIYHKLDEAGKRLYDTTIKYLKLKGRWEEIEEDLELRKIIFKKDLEL
jgi:hypothetical protein